MNCGHSFFCRSNFPRTKLFDRFKKLKNDKFPSFSQSCPFSGVMCLKSHPPPFFLFLQLKNIDFSDNPICFLCIFGSLKFSPKIGYFSLLSYLQALQNGHFGHFSKMLSFFDRLFVCLFVFFLSLSI